MKVIVYPLEVFLSKQVKNTFPSDVYERITEIDKKVVPIFVEPVVNVPQRKMIRTKKKEDVWSNLKDESLRFKSTQLQQKEGVEKDIQQFRIILNKISASNYEKQKDVFLTMIEETEKNTSELKIVATFIFDIASTNQFYASLYAALYKEVIVKNVLFQEILTSFLSQYVTNIKELKFVDPDKNYDEYCNYNKKKDELKGNTVFFVHLMKLEILPVTKILSIMSTLQELVNQNIDSLEKTQENECLSEILLLFIKEGKQFLQKNKAEWIWKFGILPHIISISQLTKKDKKGLTSKTIFSYMDMKELTEELTYEFVDL
jgi:hypothetical protein